jgi:very-short-patch-repair endonuclease
VSYHIPSPVVAAAEWEVRKELELRGLKMQYQEMVIVDAHHVDVSGVDPRQHWHGFELDGPVHRTSEKIKLRDEFLDQWFEKPYMHLWRLPYEPPLSKRRKKEVIDFIFEKMCARSVR